MKKITKLINGSIVVFVICLIAVLTLTSCDNTNSGDNLRKGQDTNITEVQGDEYQVTEKEFNEAVDLSKSNNFKVTRSINDSSGTYIVTVERFNDKIRNGWGPDESSITHSYQSTSDIDSNAYYNLTVNINYDSMIQYKDLKYDKSLSCYVGEINGYNCKVKFSNKKLKSIEIESINPEKIDYCKITCEYDCVEDFEIPENK